MLAGILTVRGGVNADCKVNILDLILTRNRLGQSTALADNWKSDVTQDGKIDITDIIQVRNQLGVNCP